LFTVESNDYLTLYKLKSYLSSPLSTVITNFKMAKKTSMLLEYPVQAIEWLAAENQLQMHLSCTNRENLRRSRLIAQPSFIITYAEQPFIDFFDERGSLLHRVDLSLVFEAYSGLELTRLEMVKLPKLVWSCRSQNLLPRQVVSNEQIQITEKIVVAGRCSLNGNERPFIARVAVSFMIPNVETPRQLTPALQTVKVDAEVIKIIGGSELDAVTALEYGPYDNGYLLVGTRSGALLVYDPLTLDRIKDFKIFTKGVIEGEMRDAEAIRAITIEPTELVVVAGANGSIAALSIVKKEMHYVYLDLGNRQFCTVAIPRAGDQDDFDTDGFDRDTLGSNLWISKIC